MTAVCNWKKLSTSEHKFTNTQ